MWETFFVFHISIPRLFRRESLRCWWLVAQRRVWALRVVFHAPTLRQNLCLLREVELTALVRLGAPPLPPPENSQDLLDVGHAAAYLGMSEKWLYRNLKILPTIRIGNGGRPRVKFRRKDLDAWIEHHSSRLKTRR